MIFELTFWLVIISLISLIGVITLSINNKLLEKILDFLVAFSVGALLGNVFIHLLPELIELGGENISPLLLTILFGILLFFILEKFVHWHHCHHAKHKYLSFSYMNLAGDFIHNILDGVILAGAFLANPLVGASTGIAIVLHEIPQEIGDFGVLLKGGFSKKKAIILNFLTALSAFIGAGINLIANSFVEGLTPIMIGIASGGFIYIACTDLIPELHKEVKLGKAIIQLIAILLGITIMASILLLE